MNLKWAISAWKPKLWVEKVELVGTRWTVGPRKANLYFGWRSALNSCSIMSGMGHLSSPEELGTVWLSVLLIIEVFFTITFSFRGNSKTLSHLNMGVYVGELGTWVAEWGMHNETGLRECWDYVSHENWQRQVHILVKGSRTVIFFRCWCFHWAQGKVELSDQCS